MDFCGQVITVNKKALRAFRNLERLLKKHSPELAHSISKRADTGAYNCRHIGGDESRPWSNHSFGIAIDILWQLNPYGNNEGLFNRTAMDFVRAAENAGWNWGGRWSTQDDMHLELAITPTQVRRRFTRAGRRK
jgi:hypothetical protein